MITNQFLILAQTRPLTLGIKETLQYETGNKRLRLLVKEKYFL